MTKRFRFLLPALVLVAMPVQADTLSYGCGGGATGGWSGAVIHDDGRVMRWTMERPLSPRVEHNLAINREGTTRLFQLLRDLKFSDLNHHSPHGNWTCSLAFEAQDGGRHEVSWGDGRVPTPPSIEAIVEELRQLLERPAS